MPLTQPTSTPDAFTSMFGTFSDWTLSDIQWYFERLGWTFHVDGDRKRISALNPDWLIAEPS